MGATTGGFTGVASILTSGMSLATKYAATMTAGIMGEWFTSSVNTVVEHKPAPNWIEIVLYGSLSGILGQVAGDAFGQTWRGIASGSFTTGIPLGCLQGVLNQKRDSD